MAAASGVSYLPSGDFYRRFGNALAARRRDAGVSQGMLAEAVGLTRTSITNIEQGRQHPSLYMALALAEGVGCALPDLLALTRRDILIVATQKRGRPRVHL